MPTTASPRAAERGPGESVTAEAVQIVKHAVKAQEQLWARYRGRTRRMWPHALGWRQGRLYALALFLDNSEPGVSRWDWVPLEELGEPRAQPGVWIGSPRGARPSSRFLEQVLVECDP